MLTLDDFLLQLMRILSDSDGLIWTVPQLTDCIRMALARVQSVCPLKLSILGLDEAEATILEDNMGILILRLAHMQAWQMRLQQRDEMYHPDGLASKINHSWQQNERQRLEAELEQVRLFYLQHSSQAPYSAWAEQPIPPISEQE